jgi:hypothetical protein
MEVKDETRKSTKRKTFVADEIAVGMRSSWKASTHCIYIQPDLTLCSALMLLALTDLAGSRGNKGALHNGASWMRLYLHCAIVVGAVFTAPSPKANLVTALLDEERRLTGECSWLVGPRQERTFGTETLPKAWRRPLPHNRGTTLQRHRSLARA